MTLMVMEDNLLAVQSTQEGRAGQNRGRPGLTAWTALSTGSSSVSLSA